MILSVDLGSPLPPYEQVRGQIATMAASGVLPAGTRLPTIRQLAADLDLAPGTISRAYRELEAAGIIVARGRHGCHVAQQPALTARERTSRLRLAAASYAQQAGQLGASPDQALSVLREIMPA
jgi:GntR family transcriptional regulator